MQRTFECNALSSATHFRVQRTFECNALSSATHFRVQRTFECNALSSATHFRVQRTFECNALSSATHFRVQRTFECNALLICFRCEKVRSPLQLHTIIHKYNRSTTSTFGNVYARALLAISCNMPSSFEA